MLSSFIYKAGIAITIVLAALVSEVEEEGRGGLHRAVSLQRQGEGRHGSQVSLSFLLFVSLFMGCSQQSVLLYVRSSGTTKEY